MNSYALLLLVATLLATGCGPLLNVRPACERNPVLVAAVDWSAVDLVNIRITREGFEPHQVELRRNQPAVLRIANVDDRPRVFNAPKFFPAAVLVKITLDDRAIAQLCPDAIDIPPHSILDIDLVPLQNGRFPFGGPDIPVRSWVSGIAVMCGRRANREVSTRALPSAPGQLLQAETLLWQPAKTWLDPAEQLQKRTVCETRISALTRL